MKEVLICADRITVLRGGRLAGTMLWESQPGAVGGVDVSRKKIAASGDRSTHPVRQNPSPLLELRVSRLMQKVRRPV